MTEQKEWIEDQGWRLVLVHMGHDGEHPPLVHGVDYGYVDHIGDPHCELYRSFDLVKGTWWQLLGPTVWLRGLLAFLKGHLPGELHGDGAQMPGMFLISDCQMIKSHRPSHAADHGDVRSFSDVEVSS